MKSTEVVRGRGRIKKKEEKVTGTTE